MEKNRLKKLIDTAAGRRPADLVIKNCRVADVFSHLVSPGDIAVCDGLIAGVGEYSGVAEIDGEGLFAAPGLIDSHVHIESSCVSPEEFGRLAVPHGTTTIIADPHEIANVCGLPGLEYMKRAAGRTALDIKYMLPSCVPSTPFEHAGAVLDAQALRAPLSSGDYLGLGEFMDFPGVIGAENGALEKLTLAHALGRPVDGHSPRVQGLPLNAYAAADIATDHECSTVEDMRNKISRGIYVLLRQGSVCRDLAALLKGLTPENSRRCLLCTDDCQAETFFKYGHLENHLRICVENGVDPLTALRMATLNPAECYGLSDRGAIAPGRRADIVLFDDLKNFNVRRVFIRGRETAAAGQYLPPVEREDISPVRGGFDTGGFSREKLRLRLPSGRANVIGITPDGVVTKHEILEVPTDENGEFVFDPRAGICKIAVIERHRGTGNAAAGLLRGYGLERGAIALSIAHDSHNIIAAGASDAEIELAVSELSAQDGGIVLVEGSSAIERMPLPIAGLMSDKSGDWVAQKLSQIRKRAADVLRVSPELDPVMTLSFMALPVIPELKLTDMGLFDVTKFRFIPVGV